MKKKRIWTGILCLLLCLCLLTGCGGENGADSAMSSSDEAWGTSPSEANEKPESIAAGLENRKIIDSASLFLESTDFEGTISALEQKTAELGGWVETSEVQNRQNSDRWAQYTLRIPAEQLDAFLTGAGEVGSVYDLRRETQEVTDQYYDAEARLRTLETQEERLLAILETADSLEYVIQLESALADVRYEIESLTGTLRRYDSQIAMSTVTVTVSEVRVASAGETDGLGHRISQQFRKSLNSLGGFAGNAVVFLVGNLPVILVGAAVLAAAAVAVRAAVRKRRAKQGENPPE